MHSKSNPTINSVNAIKNTKSARVDKAMGSPKPPNQRNSTKITNMGTNKTMVKDRVQEIERVETLHAEKVF